MKEQSPQVYKKDTSHSSAKRQDVSVAVKQPRSSNLELYRIICMLMIVAHHFVVNSGLNSDCGPIHSNSGSANSLFLSLFGAWGKTGINCFLMITGYFMCTSKITLRKFIKLMAQIYLYKMLLFPVFFIAGYEALSPLRLVELVMPVWNLDTGFLSCFIVFWLTIPFLNILVQNMTKRQHELLLVLMLTMYSLLGSLPAFHIAINYVTWFGIIYFIASYIRLYPNALFDKKGLWGWLLLLSVLMSMASVVVMSKFCMNYYWLSDCNKILAVLVAICSFLWFNNMNIKYSKVINAFGAGTFGVLLIHANSDAMRTWLWKDTVDAVGHYTLPLGKLMLFSTAVVLVIFLVCNLIDQLRIATIERWFFRWYDSKVAEKADTWIKIITGNNQ